MDILKSLIIASEKAANIARILRQNDRLLNILTEQKDSSEANPKFHEDFKTLADVLIQEMVRHDVSLKFPEIKTKIEGEENCHFWNRLGEEVNIEIKSSEEETTKMLLNIMDGETAAILAAEVHKNISFSEIDTKMPEYDFDINIDELGIWIDPIDGTNEYIKAKEDVKDGEIFLKGLKCVTVLIGVYDKNGVPIIGVINQPFFEKSKRNSYQCHWGVCYQNGNSQIKMSTVNDTCSTNNKIICVSSNENEENLKVLRDGGYTLVSPRGAGYKLLTVIIDHNLIMEHYTGFIRRIFSVKTNNLLLGYVCTARNPSSSWW
ncbi:inositol polyphosphate 1-phosphatase isoform X2 [Sitophilus oryzae]|uniref:inositol-1,4-bisphosphate 1-phosphatase n=1 Tax=Sitophilus oryzae TaxID=7048 RepID=A0A6J2YXA1_SITOR|nr:inositol polyphosphate 1-phosphatase isoform X2 [Sitophilus oryzae]